MPWTLVLDVLSAKILVWCASIGRDAVLTPEARGYFVDRYRRLADYYRARGRVAKARRLEAKAAAYGPYVPGDDGPPYAAAMAMPRPRRFVTTDAYSRVTLDGPDDAA